MMISLPGCFLQSNRRASAAQNMHTQASEKHGCIFFYSSLPGRALRQENSRLMMTEEGRSAENIGASPSANPPHYSQSLLASCASLRRQYRWLCAFRFHAYIHVWICSFGRLRRENFFSFFFGKQTLVKTQGCNICQQEERWHQTNHQRRPLLPVLISFRLRSQTLHPPKRLIHHHSS